MKNIRVALIMGGGVSLGSFSSGALAEVIRRLETNTNGTVTIDVLTGASAGAMTLGIVAYHFLRGSDTETIRDDLHRAWVKEVKFDELIPEDYERHRSGSLFSDRAVERISRDILQTKALSTSGEAHSLFAEGTRVSFALTNLNGIALSAEGQLLNQASAGDQGVDSPFKDALSTTFHDDMARLVLFRDESKSRDYKGSARVLTREDAPDWEVYRTAAIASGAFPAAFPPRQLERRATEYGRMWPEDLAKQDIESMLFDYVDGGVLRNEPLREAIHLASEIDGSAPKGGDIERWFILIDPNVSGTNEVYALPYNHAFPPMDNAGALMGVMLRFATMVMSQATFRDWLKTARVNSQLEWREASMDIVAQLEPKAGSTAEQEVQKLLERIYTEKAMRRPGSESIEPDLERIRDRITEDLKARRPDATAYSFQDRFALLLDTVANLQKKHKLNMMAITPSSLPEPETYPLAGSFMHAFGGFFDETYRQHDFDAGGYIAGRVLDFDIEGSPPFRSTDLERLARPAPIDPTPGYGTLSKDVRDSFDGFIKAHVEAATRANLPWALRIRPVRRFINSIVRKTLERTLLNAEPGSSVRLRVRFLNADGLWLEGVDGEAKSVANEDGIIETAFNARVVAGATTAHFLSGPHLLSVEPGVLWLRFWRNRGWFHSDRLELTLTLSQANAGKWCRFARYQPGPTEVALDLGAGSRQALAPPR